VVISVVGFVAQFVGLRGLHWSVTIAQLLAIGIMTILRAVVRRNLVHKIEFELIMSGYELDLVARRIKGCHYWNVIAWPWDFGSSDHVISSNQRVNEVMDTRCRLTELSEWDCHWQKSVDSTVDAIEAVINFLCTSTDVTFTDLSTVFEWTMVVEAKFDKAAQFDFSTIPLRMSREWLSDGRGWGYWKVDRSRIEAFLGLWMLQFRLRWHKSIALSILDDQLGGHPMNSGLSAWHSLSQ
jgi:hypothetical protein